MHSPDDLKRHLDHRTSILREFISGRGNVSGAGFNCYMDAALITCRSLWALLGIEANSHSETDLPNATNTKLKFSSDKDSKWNKEIRKHIAASVVITPFVSQAELTALPERNQIRKVLAAANKCVAHFANILDHGVLPEDLEAVARRLLEEIPKRILY